MTARATVVGAFALALACAAWPARGQGTAAAAYVLQRDGTTIAAHAAQQPLPPASLAKLALIVVALEGPRSPATAPDAEVTVSPAAASVEGKRVGLRAGERFRAIDVMAAAQMASANDACRALAEYVAGSAHAAVARMNALARRLGMTHTTFADPCGLDRPGQQSTASDLALLAHAALAHPLVARFAATRTTTIAALGTTRSVAVRNTNLLLGSYPEAVGLKTGYTARARHCHILVARADGVEVLLVLLGADDRWDYATQLLDAGFGRRRLPDAGTPP